MVHPSPIAAEALKDLFEQQQTNVSTTINSEDGMYQGNSDHYFAVGQSALQCVKLAMLAAGKGNLERILDLPCGYGRVLRVLKAAFPEAHLTACDILKDGVDFCAKEFGATPVYGQEELANLQIEGDFDLIWCGSLLTHLNADRWAGFIEFFNSLLAPNGLLVFTTHGRWVAQRIRSGENLYGLESEKLGGLLKGYDGEGFGYLSYFWGEHYGISVSSPSWVSTQLERLKNLRLINFTERGWDKHQDVVALARTS